MKVKKRAVHPVLLEMIERKKELFACLKLSNYIIEKMSTQ